MKTKTSVALLLCLLAGFILTGCNQSENTSSGNTNAPAPAAPSTNK